VTLAATRDALTRGELAEAYRHALAAWTATRTTARADLVHALRARLPGIPAIEGANAFKRWKKLETTRDPLDVARQVAFLAADTRQKVWREGLAELAKRPADPILARGLAAVIRTLPWRAPAALDLYRDVCAMIAAGGTPDDAAALREPNVDEIENAKMRAAVAKLLAATIRELEQDRDDPEALADVHAALAGYDARMAAHAQRTAELLDAVYANLADDGPRLVLADHLAELGDPRGELIALQCQTTPLTPKQQARVNHLVETYGKRWLPELGDRALMKDGLTFERGFVSAVRLRLHAYGDEPRSTGNRVWATVREADLADSSVADELLDPVCVSLRKISGANGAVLGLMQDKQRALPLETLFLDYGGDDRLAGLAELGRELLPSLRELDLREPRSAELVRTVVRAFAPLERVYLSGEPTAWRSLLGPELRELVCNLPSFVWRFTSDSSTARLMFWPHAWEHVHRLVPLPGIDRVILDADPPGPCDACRRGQRTLAELGAQLHAVVET
jgi:uncharacterized protein (TIGR02996 family)